MCSTVRVFLQKFNEDHATYTLSICPGHGKTIMISMLANMIHNLQHMPGCADKYKITKIYVIHFNDHLKEHAFNKYGNRANSSSDYMQKMLSYFTIDQFVDMDEELMPDPANAIAIIDECDHVLIDT